MLRRQLPAYSPLTAAGLVGGIRGVGSRPRERLEEMLADRYGARRVVLTGSGTQALTLAFRASARKDRALTVALPAYACYDVVSAAVGADARIAFYDVDPTTLAPDTDTLAEVCKRQPDAVLVAPLYGIPVAWDRVRETVAPCGALLVEDAAQGLGARWQGRPIGALGDVSVLSFGRGKGWTGGAGGALLDRRPEGAAEAPSGAVASSASVAVRAFAQWLLARPSLYWLPASLPWLGLGETEYRPPREPETMAKLAAALLLAHDPAAQRESEVRRANAADLLRGLAESEAASTVSAVRVPDGGEAGYLRLPVLAPGGMTGLANAESARRTGVMPGYPRPLPELPAARERAVEGPPTPGAARLARELVTLPTHSLLGFSDQVRALAALARYGHGPRSAEGGERH